MHLIRTAVKFKDDTKLENPGGEELDDLGYYPDGVKRTLTDEQIAMFRHSEIYSIMRERQVLIENRQADGYELSDSHSAEGLEDAQTSSDKVAETPAHQNTNHKGPKSEEAAQTSISGLSSKTTGSSKRKRHSGDSVDSQRQGHSFRRTARELDSLLADDQVLDYGDNPSSTFESQGGVADGLPMDSSASAAAESISNTSRVIRDPAVEGKKIWWPVVGI